MSSAEARATAESPTERAAPHPWRTRHGPALAAAAFGVAWLVLHVPWIVLDPTRIGWLYEGDWGAGQLGWSFFRTAPFQLPLGSNPLYPYAVGSTLGFSDSVPLVGALLRPLASVLPVDFQYMGPWLALCFALQGFAGAKLVRLVSGSAAVQALGGALFAAAPPLLHRVIGPRTNHASLSAHFLVLAFLWLALAPASSGRRRLAAALALLFASAGVHPYFTAMGAALALALALRLAAVDRLLRAPEAFAWAAAAIVTAAVGLALFGYLGGVSLGSFGFGVFSADLLSLVNPMGWSRLLPELPVREGQYEGFGWLGAGGLLLAIAAVALLALRRPVGLRGACRSAAPATVTALLLSVFALSGTVTAAGRELVRLGFYDHLPALTSAFRSSGRFLWPLHHLALLGAVAACAVGLRGRPTVLAAALAAALLVQVADVRPPEPLEVGDGGWKSPVSAEWQLARGRYRHLAMVPAFLLAGGRPAAPAPGSCGPLLWALETLYPLADAAYRLGLTFDGGYLARVDEDAAGAHCAAVRSAIQAGRVDADTVWVVHPILLSSFRAAGAICGILDGLPVCVAGSRADPFSAALRAAPAP